MFRLFGKKNQVSDKDMDDFLREEQRRLYALYKRCGGKEGSDGILSEGKWPTIPHEPEHEVFCSGELVIGHQVRRSFYETFGEYQSNSDFEGWAREIMSNPPEEHGTTTLDFCIASFEDIAGENGWLMPHEFRRFVQHPYLAAPYELIPQIYVHMIDSGKHFPELQVFAEDDWLAFPCSNRDHGWTFMHEGVRMVNLAADDWRVGRYPQGMSFITSSNPRLSSHNTFLLPKWPAEPRIKHAQLDW